MGNRPGPPDKIVLTIVSPFKYRSLQPGKAAKLASRYVTLETVGLGRVSSRGNEALPKGAGTEAPIEAVAKSRR